MVAHFVLDHDFALLGEDGFDFVAPGPDITIPTMIQGAENDQVVPYLTESERLFTKLAGPRYLVKLLSTSHLSFFDTCGCLPTDIPQAEAHRLVLRYAVPFFLHYIASKGAVIAMTRGLARELGKDNITVNALAPGFTVSENVAKDPGHMKAGDVSRASRAIQRDESPQDLVGTVSFLASEDAAFLTGQTIVVDGGSAML